MLGFALGFLSTLFAPRRWKFAVLTFYATGLIVLLLFKWATGL